MRKFLKHLPALLLCAPFLIGHAHAGPGATHVVCDSGCGTGGGTVITQPNAAPTTNGSGTITTGGTFQSPANASSSRLEVEFQNTNATDKCYIFFGASGETTSNSIVVAAGQDYLRSSGTIPSDKVWVTCQTTSDTFYFSVQ